MPSILCRLIKITPAKKLLVKLTAQTFSILDNRVTASASRLFGNNKGKVPVFTMENDEGETNHFCMVSLDKYDKQLIKTKFERHLRQDIGIEYKIAPYDFTPDGQDEPIKGINVQLTSIRKYTGKVPLFAEKKSSDSDSEEDEEEDGPNLMEVTKQGLERLAERDPSVMDLYTKMAKGGPLLTESMPLEEGMELLRKAQQLIKDELPLEQPKLVRQQAIIPIEEFAEVQAKGRRRRTPV